MTEVPTSNGNAPYTLAPPEPKRPLRLRFHYHHQQWLLSEANRRWQRFHFFWPTGRKWQGIGVTIWAHEFSVGVGPQSFTESR